MSGKPILMTSPGSHHCRRVRLLIEEAGLDVALETVEVRPPGMGGENEGEAFLAINPAGKVPVLREGDFVLAESNAIMAYLSEKNGFNKLWPEDLRERAEIAKWQFFQAAQLSPAVDGLMVENVVKSMMGQTPDKAVVAGLTEAFHRCARVIEAGLGEADYLVVDRLTCADLSVATAFMYAQAAQVPLEAHKKLSAWLGRIQARPSWAATEPPPMPIN